LKENVLGPNAKGSQVKGKDKIRTYLQAISRTVKKGEIIEKIARRNLEKQKSRIQSQ